jgi:transcriptional regulator with XRE-family HTH domain
MKIRKASGRVRSPRLPALEKMRMARFIRGITQAELAFDVGVDQTVISRLERGLIRYPKGTLIKAIAERLNIAPAEILQAELQEGAGLINRDRRGNC